jgi:hypothetical protein
MNQKTKKQTKNKKTEKVKEKKKFLTNPQNGATLYCNAVNFSIINWYLLEYLLLFSKLLIFNPNEIK